MGSDKLEVLLCQIYSSIVAMCCKLATKHCRYSNLVWQGLQPHYRRPGIMNSGVEQIDGIDHIPCRSSHCASEIWI